MTLLLTSLISLLIIVSLDAIFVNIKLRNAKESIIEKESIIDSLQIHVTTLEDLLTIAKYGQKQEVTESKPKKATKKPAAKKMAAETKTK